MRILRISTALTLVAAACQGPAIGWHGLATEDPDPPDDPELRIYKETHYRQLGTRLEVAERAALIEAAGDADLLFLGDHHSDRGLHGEHLALLEELHRRGVPITLGVEAVGIEDEAIAGRYLGRGVDLATLRATVRRRWPESWLDSPEVDAPHYRALLAFARRTGTPVFALEPTPRVPLSRRDRVIAASVAAAVRPDRLTVVVVGHTHLLGDHHVVDRVSGRVLVVGARLSNTLRRGERPGGSGYLRSDAGVWFPPQAR